MYSIYPIETPIPITSVELSMVLFESTVMAGFPSPTADHALKRIDLNEHLLLNRDASFLF